MPAVIKAKIVLFGVLTISLCGLARADESDLAWSTFLGGSSNEINHQQSIYGIAVGYSGCVYVTGGTYSDDFPTTYGAFDTTHNAGWDVFVTKFDPAGSHVVYSTFLGDIGDERGSSIAVDGDGCVYVTGVTNSDDFPTTSGSYDQSHNGAEDVFVSKLGTCGDVLIFSSYLGGTAWDMGTGIVVNSEGSIFVTGSTGSGNFPTTSDAYDRSYNGSHDVFVSRMNSTGSDLSFSTFLGGGSYDYGYSISLDGDNKSYVTGRTCGDFPTTQGAFDNTFNGGHWWICDAFVAKLNAVGSALDYSTYLGGFVGDDMGWDIAVDDSGCAYVTGETYSPDFPITPWAYDIEWNDTDCFVVKLNRTGSDLVYSTFLGGEGEDWGNGIALDGMNNAYVTGSTVSFFFPTTPEAFDTTNNPGDDVFITKLNSIGNALAYSTYLGGIGWDRGHDIALDGSGNAYVAGWTQSGDFPTTLGAFDTTYNGGDYDAFVSRLDLGNYFAPPEPIEDLTIFTVSLTPDTIGDLHLGWSEAHSDAGVSHYVIYRSTDPTFSGDSLASTTDTVYVDVDVTGDVNVNYFYTVRAVDVAGKRSEHSNMVGEFDRYLSPCE